MVRIKPTIPSARVVVTGIGIISPVGIGAAQVWGNLINGSSGIGPLTLFSAEEQGACKIAGEALDFDPLQYIDPKRSRRMDRFAQMAVSASEMARLDANLTGHDPERTGVLIGTASGGWISAQKNLHAIINNGPDRCSPFTVPLVIPNMASGWVSMLQNAQGPVLCTSTACATSADAIGQAYRIIQRGEADVMFAGGAEAPITPLCLSGFMSARTLSTRNDDATRASRPFDKDRDGFVISEGSAVLLLESLDHAIKRGARIWAEIVGYGRTADAYDMVAPRPNGAGAARAMKLAIADAQAAPDEISYVNAHATSTVVGDRAETAAIKQVFGDRAYTVPISSTKSMTGHMMGAAGAMEAAISCMVTTHGQLPPTINLDSADPECDLDYIPNVARPCNDVKLVMSNSFGFGGHNACLVFEKYSAANNN
jgi:3-oxoacyl-[acyl-carrier-protein] synthase II